MKDNQEQGELGGAGVWAMATVTGVLGIVGAGPLVWIAGGITLALLVHDSDPEVLPDLFGYTIALPDRTRHGIRKLADGTRKAKQRIIESTATAVVDADPAAPMKQKPVHTSPMKQHALPGVMNAEINGEGDIPVLFDGEQWYYLSLVGEQHWGVFGASGGGKGNLLQLIALEALMRGPDACQVWVLDCKSGLDYGFARHVRHGRLYSEAENDDGSLTEGYTAATQEMRRREGILKAVDARNVGEYTGNEPMPTLLLICDEVAELDNEQRRMLSTLARMGRAAGIVLCVATQYPTVEALPSQVQSNLINRVVFRLASAQYTPVALRLAPGETPRYEPAHIKEPGIAVLRGASVERDVQGRVPFLDNTTRDRAVAVLKARWPRGGVSGVSGETETDSLLVELLGQTVNDEGETEEPKQAVSSVSCGFMGQTDIDDVVCETGFDDDETETETDETEPQLLTPAAIRQMYERFGGDERRGAKSRVWEWMRDEFGMRNKAEAFRRIGEALEEPPVQFRWLLDDERTQE